VEAARLLLLSESGRHPGGLANSSGLVGKYFMDHHRTDIVCEFEKPLSLPFFRALSFQHNTRPVGTRDIGLLLTFKASPTPEDLIRQYYWGRSLRDRILSDTATELLIACTVESIPERESAVGLDPDRKDVFGSAAPRISYRLSADVRTALDRGLQVIRGIASRLAPATAVETGELYLAHHMGTCRMSVDPAEGVVNPDLVTHDVPNLMVVGSAVFVTGGCVNPSLTISALALRAVEFIATRYAA
jgi:choline dehydrogenase-like flavoprotein